MKHLLALAAFVAAFSIPPAPAQAQQRPSPECSDDAGVDRCAAAQQQRVRQLYGVPAIEELRDAGSRVRRVFYVDGYGRDLIALTFIRAPGQDPRMILHWPRTPSAPRQAPAETLLSQAVWEEVLARSAYFDWAVTNPRKPNPNSASICLHAWVYTVEAVEPDRGAGAPATIRRKVEDACSDGLAQPYAHELAKVALAALPYCAALDPDLHRNAASMLAACRLLEGDRLAAAEGFNQALRLARINRPDESLRIRQAFQSDAVLDWAGRTSGGRSSEAAGAWIGQVVGGKTGALYIERVVGERADRVRAEGRFVRSVEQDGGPQRSETAPVVLELEGRPHNPGLRVQRATVGAFAPERR